MLKIDKTSWYLLLTEDLVLLQLTSKIKRPVQPPSEVKFFKANKFKVWLFYFGPLLLKKKAYAFIFERFSILSYAVRLMMISDKYAAEAGELINEFLKRNRRSVHQYRVLPISSRADPFGMAGTFGPLWACSSMMFESANYLLQSMLAGAIPLLPLSDTQIALEK